MPEISGSSSFDMAELAERVSELASLAQEYAAILSDADFISECPNIPSSGLVLISKKVAKDVGAIFRPLANDIESLDTKRKCFEIDYRLLGRGFPNEVRFALGKIILDTLNDGALQGEGESTEVGEDNVHNLWKEQKSVNEKNQRALSNLVDEEENKIEISLKSSKDVWLKDCTIKQKKLKLGKRSSSEEKTESKNPKVVKVKRSGKIADLVQEVPDENLNYIKELKSIVGSKTLSHAEKKSGLEYSISDKQQNAGCSDSLRKSTNKQEKSLSNNAGATKKADWENQQESAKANSNPLLSDIFR